MKKLIYILPIFLFFFIACDNKNDNPDGPDGPGGSEEPNEYSFPYLYTSSPEQDPFYQANFHWVSEELFEVDFAENGEWCTATVYYELIHYSNHQGYDENGEIIYSSKSPYNSGASFLYAKDNQRDYERVECIYVYNYKRFKFNVITIYYLIDGDKGSRTIHPIFGDTPEYRIELNGDFYLNGIKFVTDLDFHKDL